MTALAADSGFRTVRCCGGVAEVLQCCFSVAEWLRCCGSVAVVRSVVPVDPVGGPATDLVGDLQSVVRSVRWVAPVCPVDASVRSVVRSVVRSMIQSVIRSVVWSVCGPVRAVWVETRPYNGRPASDAWTSVAQACFPLPRIPGFARCGLWSFETRPAP